MLFEDAERSLHGSAKDDAQAIRAKLKAVKAELWHRMYWSLPEQAMYVRAVVLGHMRYYVLPGNSRGINAFRHKVAYLWWRTLFRRRSQRGMSWVRMLCYLDRWLPSVHIYHPWPLQRYAVATQGKSRMR